jgi:hypothetical protein
MRQVGNPDTCSRISDDLLELDTRDQLQAKTNGEPMEVAGVHMRVGMIGVTFEVEVNVIKPVVPA